MQSRVQEILRQFDRDLAVARDAEALEAVRTRYLGRRAGLVTALLRNLREVAASERASFGKAVNDLKVHVEGALEQARDRLGGAASREAPLDPTLPGRAQRP